MNNDDHNPQQKPAERGDTHSLLMERTHVDLIYIKSP